MSANMALNPPPEMIITPDKPMNIVIIGGSNTGLMVGTMLKHLGHNVHILEKATQSERSDLAAGIGTHPEFKEYMKKHDLVEGPWCVECPGAHRLNQNGTVGRKLNLALQLTSWGSIYHRLRANFDGLASAFCPNPPAKSVAHGLATYDHGKVATALNNTGEKIQVRFEDLVNPRGHGTLDADFVILADGAMSRLRGAFFPDIKREYAGYVIFRGTVLESDVSEETKTSFCKKLTYFSWKDNYILLYIIPGANGSLEPGHRLYNWAWYHPLEARSPSFTEIMTDTSGILHRNTLPANSMNLKAWEKYKAIAAAEMCAPFVEVVEKTTQPFITAIGDLTCPRATAMGGRIIVMGEALNLLRPHLALSTTTSAKQTLLLEKVFRGELSIEQWEAKVLYDAKISALKSNAFGIWQLFGPWAAVGWLVKLAIALVGGYLPSSPLPQIPTINVGKKQD